MAPEPWTDWHTSVCDCFEDASTCKDQWRRLVSSSACTALACLCVVLQAATASGAAPAWRARSHPGSGRTPASRYATFAASAWLQPSGFRCSALLLPPWLSGLPLETDIRSRCAASGAISKTLGEDLNAPSHFCQGSLCKDVAASCFCVWCSWCQMLRELNYRRNKPTVINIVSVQPASAAQPNPVIQTYPLHTGVLVAPRWASCRLAGGNVSAAGFLSHKTTLTFHQFSL